jgi:hypothetical protein
MAESENLPAYIASNEFLAELRELGHDDFIELDDLIDFLDEDPAYILELHPTIIMIDEMNYLSPAQVEFIYDLTIDKRPT